MPDSVTQSKIRLDEALTAQSWAEKSFRFTSVNTSSITITTLFNKRYN